MAFLNNFFRLKATAFVLWKLDVEQIADYLADYGEKYREGKQKFIDMIYYKLLELVSAVNRRRVK